MTRRSLFITFSVLALAGALLIYFFFDPLATPGMPKCLFHQLTGLQCPGCGSQRMIHALLNGDIASAWQFNPFLFFALPWVILLAFLELFPHRYTKLRERVYSAPAIITILGLILLWTILRNLI